MKKCKSCGAEIPFTIQRNGMKNYDHKYGYGIKCGCYSEWLLTTDEGKKQLEKATLKATKPRRELEKEAKRRKNANKLQNLLDSIKQACHAYIRKRDEGKPCISCGAKWNPEFQAGHFYKAELYSSLRFDEHNINGQCRVCNLHKDGNFEGYRSGFVKRFGLGKLHGLEVLAETDKQTDFKWDREELKRIRTYYKDKLKHLEIGRTKKNN